MNRLLYIRFNNNLFKYKCLKCKNIWLQYSKSKYKYCPHCGIEFNDFINNKDKKHILHIKKDPINVILIESKSEIHDEWIIQRICDPSINPKIILKWFKDIKKQCNTKDVSCELRLKMIKYNKKDHELFLWRD